MITKMRGEVEVVESVPKRFAEIVVDAYKHRSEEKFLLALSGGSSAEPCYEELNKASRAKIDWSEVEIFWSDERCVPLDDKASNAGNAKRIFIDKLEPAPEIFPMSCEDGPDSYEFLLRTHSPIDIIHLGVGPDGHTASLFPNSTALEESERLVLRNEDPSSTNPIPRMTFTYAGIANSKHVVFTAFGAKKAEILRELANGADLPAAHVRAPKITWLLDADAAQLL